MKYRSNFYGETTLPGFSFPTEHEDLKKKRIRFVKDRQTSLALNVVFIIYATLHKFVSQNGKNVKRAPFTNSLKPVLSIYENNIGSSALPKTP